MDENHAGSAGSIKVRRPFPSVEDHLVQAEVTRDELIGGRLVVASPVEPSQATQQCKLNFVLHAHVGPGYLAAADLLTRFDHESDFGTDACVYKDGIDPETGTRYLEEIAFEVVSDQNEDLVAEKAVRMHRRGVKRIFTVWVKGQPQVCEWSPESQSWSLLDRASSIEEPCLVRPLPVAALLDDEAADNAVLEALAAKGIEAAVKAMERRKSSQRLSSAPAATSENSARG